MENHNEQVKTPVEKVEEKKRIFHKIINRSILSTVLIVCGLALILTPFIGKMVADYKQKDMLEEFYTVMEQTATQEPIDSDLAALDEALLWGSDEINQAESNTNYETVSNEFSGSQLAETATLDEMPSTLGIIEIDKIDLKYPIGEGTGLDTLRYVIGHMPESAPLNEIGNAILAGHRSHSFGTFFNRLDELELGDEITITSINGEVVTYKVYDKLIVEPDDFSIMRGSSNYRVITLITCHPLYNPDKRLIIHAIDVEQLESVNNN